MLLLLKLQEIREQVLIKKSYSKRYSSRWFFFSVWRRDSLVPESCGLEECYISMCGWQALGWRVWGVFFWAVCQMNSLAGVTALMWHWAALVWRLLGNRGHPAQIHQGTLKDLGLAELSTLPTALWSLCGSVTTTERDLWVQESWPSFPWASETKLLFLQAVCQINIFL